MKITARSSATCRSRSVVDPFFGFYSCNCEQIRPTEFAGRWAVLSWTLLSCQPHRVTSGRHCSGHNWRPHSHARTHARTHTHSRTHARTRTHTRTHTHTHTHAYTRTHIRRRRLRRRRLRRHTIIIIIIIIITTTTTTTTLTLVVIITSSLASSASKGGKVQDVDIAQTI